MKESKESVETLFRIRDDEGNILAESDTLVGLLMKFSGLDDEGAGKLSVLEDEEDDEDDDDFIDMSCFFHEPHNVEIFRIEITPKKILKAAGVIGGLIAMRRLWKRMKG